MCSRSICAKNKEIINASKAAYNRYALGKRRPNLVNHQIQIIHPEQKCIVLFVFPDFVDRIYQLF